MAATPKVRPMSRSSLQMNTGSVSEVAATSRARLPAPARSSAGAVVLTHRQILLIQMDASLGAGRPLFRTVNLQAI